MRGNREDWSAFDLDAEGELGDVVDGLDLDGEEDVDLSEPIYTRDEFDQAVDDAYREGVADGWMEAMEEMGD